MLEAALTTIPGLGFAFTLSNPRKVVKNFLPARCIIGTHSKGFARFGRGAEVAERLECVGQRLLLTRIFCTKGQKTP